jgi:hypothetical protein
VANPSEVNFCKLFWAYIFVIPGLILHGLLEAGERLAKIGEDGRTKRALAKTEAEDAPEPEPRGPGAMQRYLNWIGDVASRLIMRFTPNEATKRLLGIAGMALMVAFGVGAVIAFFYFLVLWWTTTRWILLGGVGLLAIILISFLMVNVLDRIGFGTWLAQREPGRGFFRGIKEFFHVMGLGYHAVKSNTCPKVEIVKEP